MLNLHRVLFGTGINLDDSIQIDCLAYKYFVFYRLSLVGYNIWYCLVCDYMGYPPTQSNFHLSEFLKLIIIRISCEF